MSLRAAMAGAAAGLIGLGMALSGDALVVYRGLWVYLSLLPPVVAALAFGPVAGLLAGALTGAAGGSPFVAAGVGLWLALVGSAGRRRRPGLVLLVSVPLVLTPLVAAGFGLGDQRDPIQVWALLRSLWIALVPTAVVFAVLAWAGAAAVKRFGVRAASALGVVLLVAALMLVPRPERDPGAAWAFGAGGPYRAGFALADISPSPAMLQEGVYLGGYGGRKGPAQSVHDPIYFRVLAVQQDLARLILVQTDTVGMGNRMYTRLRAAAVKAGGTEQVFIGATHSHAAPDLQGIWGGVPAAYEDFLIERLSGAVAEAVARLEPVELKVGGTRLQVARNRRDWGAVPEQMSVLQAAAPDGRIVCTLINFSVHPTVLPRENMAISADFVGPMLAAVGGPALFFNGAQGDVVPDGAGLAGSMFDRADAYGRRLAEGAAKALASAGPVPVGPISVETVAVQAPLENWGFQTLMSLGILRYDVAHAGLIPGIRTHVSLVRLGPDVTLVTVPGEMVTRLWTRVEESLPPGHRFVLGLTQDSLGYIITRDEWATGRNGDYEESVSVGPVIGPLMEKTITELLR